MINFTLHSNKGKIGVKAPSSWEEISYQHLIEIEQDWDGEDLVKLFSILTGVEYEALKHNTDPDIDETLYLVCGFVLNDTPDWIKLPPPKTIVYDEKVIRIPTDLRSETLAQKMMINNVLKSDISVMEAIPLSVSIYLHPKIFEGAPVDQHLMEELAKELKKRNAMEVYSIGNFFFRKLKQYQRIMLLNLLRKNKILLKNSQTLSDSKHSKTWQWLTDLLPNTRAPIPTMK